MPRYVRRSDIVEAVRWYPGRDVPGVFVEDPRNRDAETDEADPSPDLPVRHFVVSMWHQRVYLKPGDYVIAEADGRHHYRCAADAFAEEFEPID